MDGERLEDRRGRETKPRPDLAAILGPGEILMSLSVRLAPLALVLLAGCARPDVLAVEQPGPTRSADTVELLLDAPGRPYRTVAVIRSAPRNLFRDMERLKQDVREAAAAMGADAVILSLSAQEGSSGTGLTAEGTPVSVSSSGELRVVGRAIVYEGS
jgi:hypothetical protein